MSNQAKQSKAKEYIGWGVKRATLILFDALASYLAYFLALVIRFSTRNQFRPIADEYLPHFYEFAPWYALLVVVVFIAFRLYDSHWKHAGLNDLNRIFFANLTTTVIHVAGTVLFTRRMPITYYVIGATLQFMAIAASRFAYRIFTLEKVKVGKLRRTSINVMIVGTGETARVVRQQIEQDPKNVARPVCVFAYRDGGAHARLDGLPVVTGMNKLKEHMEKYAVWCVILADSIMPTETRKEIKQICAEAKVEVQDFSGYLTNEGRSVTLQKLMEYTSGPVEVLLNEKLQHFENGEQALMAYPGKYEVKRLYASENRLGVEIAPKSVILNDINAGWVKDTEKAMGNEISFF